MADYQSSYTGAEIDAGIGKANTAIQATDIATTSAAGVVMVDGSTITITDGVISASGGGGSSGADTSLSNLTDAGKIMSAKLASPSVKKDTITIGAAGTSYAAPANGWFNYIASLNSTSSAQFILASSKMTVAKSGNYQTTVGLCLPVQKGDSATLMYTLSPTTAGLYFVYAEGSESEYTGT